MKHLITALTVLASASTAAHAGSISTLGLWDGSSAIDAWGGNATNTYGEVFTAPGGALTSFTFEVNDYGSPANYTAEVYAWDDAAQGVAGPALYTSAPMTSSGDGAFDAITINTGGVALTTGSDYVIDLYDNSGDGVAGVWGLIGPVGYHPGVANDVGFAFVNGPSSSSTWDSVGDFGSLAYSASFGAVPEPASWALMLVGVMGLGAALRTSRKTSADLA